MAKLKTVTLGCKVNQYETQLVREGLLSIGFTDALDQQPADLCVVNTCTVTNEGDAKSRQVIRRLARDNPQARIVVMGCYATRAPDELAQLPNVEEVVTDKREIPDLLGRFGVVDLPQGISQFGDRHRAYVKVQDGCLLRCSYCIIPYVRPQMSSRPPEQIREEVRRLVDNGYREIVLTGIHLGHYGVDWNWNQPKERWIRLVHLLEGLLDLPGDFRIRLSSIEATEVTRELVAVIAAGKDRICPHFHICLQSGSDRILRKMRRRWGAKRFVSRCELIRESLSKPAFTTDVIVGFPGETEEDFADTCRVVRQVGFSKLHIFPFSARKGTPAADYSPQVPKRVKAERGQQLAELEAELRADYLNSLVGDSLQVLSESVDERGTVVGTSCRYAAVEVPPAPTTANNSALGQLLRVRIASSTGQRLVGTLDEPG